MFCSDIINIITYVVNEENMLSLNGTHLHSFVLDPCAVTQGRFTLGCRRLQVAATCNLLQRSSGVYR